jgi:hypothetical protein
MTSRHLPDVIAQLLAQIPETEATKRLRTRLESVRQSAAFTPPENMWIKWRTVGEILLDEIGLSPTEPWAVVVRGLFVGPKAGGSK